jgi:hypothetical protein
MIFEVARENRLELARTPASLYDKTKRRLFIVLSNSTNVIRIIMALHRTDVEVICAADTLYCIGLVRSPVADAGQSFSESLQTHQWRFHPC